MSKLFVIGFAFSPAEDEVVLIRKRRLGWQAGRLNGVGGHIEAGELPIDAMRREFEEETGVLVYDWTHFATIHRSVGKAEFFSCLIDVTQVRTCTDEEVGQYSTYCLPDDVVPDIHWLIPMALHIDEDSAQRIEIRAVSEVTTEVVRRN